MPKIRFDPKKYTDLDDLGDEILEDLFVEEIVETEEKPKQKVRNVRESTWKDERHRAMVQRKPSKNC